MADTENPVAIRAVVFDMGGVIIKLGPLADVLEGAGLSPSEIMERWILSDAVRRFEGGQGTVNEFAENLIAELGVTLEPDALIDRFIRFPQGLYPGAVAMVAAVREQMPVAVLSNTNELHWTTRQDHEQVQAMFDRQYLSFELGLVKPDAPIYEHACADLGLERGQVLFVDDNQVNVDGAIAAGLQAVRGKGPVEVTTELQRLGVL